MTTGVPDATTGWPQGDPDVYGGLLRDIDQGYAKRLAIVVPEGAVWPLPAYELALATAGKARSMGHVWGTANTLRTLKLLEPEQLIEIQMFAVVD